MSDEELKTIDVDGDGKADAIVKLKNGDVFISIRWVIMCFSALVLSAGAYINQVM